MGISFLFTSLLFTAIRKASSDSHFAFLHFFSLHLFNLQLTEISTTPYIVFPSLPSVNAAFSAQGCFPFPSSPEVQNLTIFQALFKPRQEYWSGLTFSSPGDLPNPEIKFKSPHWQMDSLPLSHQEAHLRTYLCLILSLNITYKIVTSSTRINLFTGPRPENQHKPKQGGSEEDYNFLKLII